MRKQLHRPRGQAGFTLVELVIVMAIIPIVAVAVSIPLIEWPKLYAGIQADREMAEQARAVLKWIGKDVRQATAVLPSWGPYQTESHQALILEMPAGTETRAVVWVSTEQGLSRIEFSDDNDRKPVDQTMLASAKATLNFDLDEPPPDTACVDVAVDLERSVLERDLEFGLSGLFCMRRSIQ